MCRRLPGLKTLDTVDLYPEAAESIPLGAESLHPAAVTMLTAGEAGGPLKTAVPATEAPLRLSQMSTASVLAALAQTATETDPDVRAMALRRQLQADAGVATLHSVDTLCEC